jgi:hypothetical protein
VNRRGRGETMATLGLVKRGVAVLALGAALFAGGLTADARTRSCGTVSAPGYHAFNTKARGLRCTSARKIVKRWLDADAKPSSGPRGWRCRRSLTEPWSCRRDRERISFIFHSYK